MSSAVASESRRVSTMVHSPVKDFAARPPYHSRSAYVVVRSPNRPVIQGVLQELSKYYSSSVLSTNHNPISGAPDADDEGVASLKESTLNLPGRMPLFPFHGKGSGPPPADTTITTTTVETDFIRQKLDALAHVTASSVWLANDTLSHHHNHGHTTHPPTDRHSPATKGTVLEIFAVQDTIPNVTSPHNTDSALAPTTITTSTTTTIYKEGTPAGKTDTVAPNENAAKGLSTNGSEDYYEDIDGELLLSPPKFMHRADPVLSTNNSSYADNGESTPLVPLDGTTIQLMQLSLNLPLVRTSPARGAPDGVAKQQNSPPQNEDKDLASSRNILHRVKRRHHTHAPLAPPDKEGALHHLPLHALHRLAAMSRDTVAPQNTKIRIIGASGKEGSSGVIWRAEKQPSVTTHQPSNHLMQHPSASFFPPRPTAAPPFPTLPIRQLNAEQQQIISRLPSGLQQVAEAIVEAVHATPRSPVAFSSHPHHFLCSLPASRDGAPGTQGHTVTHSQAHTSPPSRPDGVRRHAVTLADHNTSMEASRVGAAGSWGPPRMGHGLGGEVLSPESPQTSDGKGAPQRRSDGNESLPASHAPAQKSSDPAAQHDTASSSSSSSSRVPHHMDRQEADSLLQSLFSSPALLLLGVVFAASAAYMAIAMEEQAAQQRLQQAQLTAAFGSQPFPMGRRKNVPAISDVIRGSWRGS